MCRIYSFHMFPWFTNQGITVGHHLVQMPHFACENPFISAAPPRCRAGSGPEDMVLPAAMPHLRKQGKQWQGMTSPGMVWSS